jgi:SAM-dependent methyltransferase
VVDAVRDDVLSAYRDILGREPEDDDVVEHWLERRLSRAGLRAVFRESEEYRSKGAKRPRSALSGLDVQLDVGDEDFTRMIRRIESAWEKLGVSEPHWSVLTDDNFKQRNLPSREPEFFSSGKKELAAMEAAAARAGIDLAAFKQCLELGAGVGRVTLWLARRFEHVIACDISASHLAIARQAAAREGIDNVTFETLKAISDLEALPPFDAFFSVIVLQHNPPPVIDRILRTLLDKLLPGGIAYFQVPTYRDGYNFLAVEYLEGESEDGIEMHLIPQAALFGLIEDADCELLEIREEDRTGVPTMVSNNLLLRKRYD